MSLTAVVATIGRPSLQRTLSSIETHLPGAQVVLVPAPDVEATLRERFPSHVVGPAVDDLYSAWNAGLRLVDSSHCIFVNDDDRLEGRPLRSDDMPRSASDLTVLRFTRDGERRTQPSMTRLLRSRSPMLIDILRGTRVMINAVLWPIELFDEVGSFSSKYRIRGDAEWMQRLAGHSFRFRWARGPIYVQDRSGDRLSSRSGPNEQRLLTEANVLARHIIEQPGRSFTHAAIAKAWLWNVHRARGRQPVSTLGQQVEP